MTVDERYRSYKDRLSSPRTSGLRSPKGLLSRTTRSIAYDPSFPAVIANPARHRCTKPALLLRSPKFHSGEVVENLSVLPRRRQAFNSRQR